MKNLLIALLCFAPTLALADQPCSKEMSKAAYEKYAKEERISVAQAQSNADLFIDLFLEQGKKLVYEVELAEQYNTGSESGWASGNNYKVTLTKKCKVESVDRIAR